MKKLKSRPELNAIYGKVTAGTGKLNYSTFSKLMSETQKVSFTLVESCFLTHMCPVFVAG